MSGAVQAMFLFQGFLTDNPELLLSDKPARDYNQVSTAHASLARWVELLGSASDFCWQLEIVSWKFFECEVSEKFGRWLRDNTKAPIEAGVQEIVRLVRLFLEGHHTLTDHDVARLCSGIYAAAAKSGI